MSIKHWRSSQSNGRGDNPHAVRVAPAPVEYLDERFTAEPKAAPAGGGGGGGKGPSGPDDGKYTNVGDEPNNDKFKKGPDSPDWSSYGNKQGKMGEGKGNDENPKSGDYYK